jgi:H+/Cl- antiporter ClcA
MWSLTSEVQARGDTHYGQSSVTIIESPKRQTSENVVFLIIAAAGICIGAVGLVYVSAIELFGSRKKKKKRKRK